MAHVEVRVPINRRAHDIAEFVMDVRRYQQVDAKLGKIYWVRRDGNEVEFKFQPRLLGVPGPPTVQRIVLSEDGSTIGIEGVPSWTDKLMSFSAAFLLEEANDVTWVTRRLSFEFPKAVALLIDAPLQRWLSKDVPAELAKAKERLEGAGKP